jgi:hypothetical protein
VTLLLLAAIGVAGFTWFAYWPLEGRVARVDALVPSDVDFLYRTSWTEIRQGGWLRRNLVDDPVHPDLDPARVTVDDQGTTLSRSLERIPETEEEINASIPGALKVLQRVVFGTGEFRVEKDLVPAEVVAAGRWCPGGNPAEGPPKWRQILLLTRVSPLVKFAFEAVRHDFVRERAVARRDLEIEAQPDGILRVELRNVRPPRRAQTCEGGLEMTPMNVWYVVRVKDVLAIGNAEDLVAGVAAVAQGSAESAVSRPGFDVERPEGGIAAALDLVGLRSYLNRFFSSGSDTDKLGAFLGKFVAIDALDRADAVVTLPSDGVLARANVAWSEDRLRPFKDVEATYRLSPSPVAEGIARLLPAKDTALVAQLRTPPRALLHALYDNLSKADQKLIQENLRDIGRRRRAAGQAAYDDVGEFIDELAQQLGTETGVAVARLSSVFDRVRYAEWYSSDDPAPTATLAAMFRVRPGARQADVDEFLGDRVGALGFGKPEPVTSPEGITYSRLRLRKATRDYELVEPAFKVHDGYVILCTREDYLLEILKVMAGGPGAPPSVAASPAFRGIFGSLPSDATLALYADFDVLRSIAWDFRNDRVRRTHDDAAYAASYRARRIAELSPSGVRTDFQQIKAQVDEEVGKEMERYRREEYPRFVEAYRERLDATRRIQAAGIVLAARPGDTILDTGARILFAPSRPVGE